MKKKNKINWNDTPSNVISFRYASIAFIIVIILMLIIPKILNYGPGMINTEFDIKMSNISFNTQFFIIGLVVITGIVLFTKIFARKGDPFGTCKGLIERTQAVSSNGHHQQHIRIHVLCLGFKNHVVKAAANGTNGERKCGKVGHFFADHVD